MILFFKVNFFKEFVYKAKSDYFLKIKFRTKFSKEHYFESKHGSLSLKLMLEVKVELNLELSPEISL